MGGSTTGAHARAGRGRSPGKTPREQNGESKRRAPGERRQRGNLPRGLLAALLLHGNLLAPLLIATFIYAAREEAQRAEEVDVGFEDVPPEQLPQDLPPLDDTPQPLAPAPKEKVDHRAKTSDPKDQKDPKKRDEAVRKPEEKLAEEKPQPPEPEVPIPPLPPMPPPPPPQPKLHEKMVDLDNDKEVEPPPDAKYLAQKNNRVDEETRATQTNLEREQKGGEGSQTEKGERRDDKEIGDDKAKIAELDEQKSRLGRAAPEVTPQKETESLDRPDQIRPRAASPVLSLRDASPRGHELTPETVDPSLPHDPAGMLARPRARGAFRDDEAEHSHEGGKRVKLALSGKDYEYLFGKEAQADRQLKEKERSTRLGKYAKGAARVRSALENFINEVKPGNQTALNTRAAPFAAFIARMHRNIHQLWGFGTLEDWDELPSSSPLNDETLVTTLEIELNRDGTVSKVSMVRASKYLPYDAAAIDVVLNAAPYPEPPREIRSGNGKVYVHWSFFRDGHQCATSGVDYFILNNGPKSGDLASASAEGRVPATVPPAAAPGSPPGPRRLERKLGETDQRRPVLEAMPGGASPEGISDAAKAAGTADAVDPQDKRTRDFARAWFAAFVRGDVAAMTARAGFPFRSTAGVVAKSRAELTQMLNNLIAESPRRATAPVSVETAASLRKLIGKLPPGIDDGSGTLYAVTSVENDLMIILLGKNGPEWRVTGLLRR